MHLMNKMNLPPPFKELETEFPMLREMYNIGKHKDIFDNEVADRMSGKNCCILLHIKFIERK